MIPARIQAHAVIPTIFPEIRGIDKGSYGRRKELVANVHRGAGVDSVVLNASRDDVPDRNDMTRELSASQASRFLGEDLTVAETKKGRVNPFLEKSEVQIEELAFQRTGLLQVSREVSSIQAKSSPGIIPSHDTRHLTKLLINRGIGTLFNVVQDSRDVVHSLALIVQHPIQPGQMSQDSLRQKFRIRSLAGS